MRATVAMLMLHAIAATNSGPVCAILDPIISVMPGEICACQDSASGVGGTAACTMMVPSDQPIELVPAIWPSAAVVINPVTFAVGTEVLPCGDPASAAVHATITVPCGNFDVSSFEPIINQAIAAAGGAAAGLSVSFNSANDLVISIEKTASATQSANVDLPMFVIPMTANVNFRLIVTVSGNLDSMTIDTAVDLCLVGTGNLGLTLGVTIGQELCGSSIPATFNSLLLEPPWEIFQLQAQSFSSACSANAASPPPPPPPPLPLPLPLPPASALSPSASPSGAPSQSNTATVAPPPAERAAVSPPPPSMSNVEFTLELQGDVSDFTTSVLAEVKSAIATTAGVDVSNVEVSVAAGSVVLDVSIRVPTATASTVQSTMATATSAPSSATTMLASVTGVAITVTAITTPPAIVAVAAGGGGGSSSSASAGMDGGAVFGIIVGILILCCLLVAILWKLEKLPEKLQTKISNKVHPSPKIINASCDGHLCKKLGETCEFLEQMQAVFYIYFHMIAERCRKHNATVEQTHAVIDAIVKDPIEENWAGINGWRN